MKIKITFLGTGSAIPTSTRNHTAIFLKYKEEGILIDCGEGTQRQLRIEKIKPSRISKILLTHLHGDHTFGLPGLFQTLVLNNYQKTLEIYGPKGTKKYIQTILNDLIKTKKIPIKIIEVTNKVFQTNDLEVTSYPLKHDIETIGYIIKEKDKLRIKKEKLKKLNLKNSQEIKKLTEGKDIMLQNKKIKSKDLTYLQKGKKISFIFDTKNCSNVKKLAKDSDLAIIESTFSEKQKELTKEYFHMTATEAAKIAKENNVKKLILTHFSQRYEHKEKLLLEEAKNIFKNTELAKDFLTLEI